MSRAPFQVLVMPFRATNAGSYEFAALCRADDGRWQGVAGGGEGAELPCATAAREVAEELCLAAAPIYRLDTTASIPVHHFSDRSHWPDNILVVPEYSFAVDCAEVGLHFELSSEHMEQRWGSYRAVSALLTWDSNRTALWELNQLLIAGVLAGRLV